MGPSQVAGAGMGAGVGGTVLSAFGAAMSGSSQSSMLNYQAGVAQLRQKIDLQNRDYVLAAGETEQQQYGMKARSVMGKIRAAQGASGVDVGSGSAADVRQGQQLVTSMDEATLRNNTARKAYGFASEAATDAAQADLYSRAASNVSKATPFNVASSLVSGASGVASKWLQYNSTFGSGGGSGASSIEYGG